MAETKKAGAKVSVLMTLERETKGTYLYKEAGDYSTHKIGSLYIKKRTLEELGAPGAKVITVTVEITQK